MARHGFPLSMFRNLNTPEELAEATRVSELALEPMKRTIAGS